MQCVGSKSASVGGKQHSSEGVWWVEVSLQDPTAQQQHRPALDLAGAAATVATDYVKRPHVFRLKLSSGGDYLFQCKDDVSVVNSAASSRCHCCRYTYITFIGYCKSRLMVHS